MKKLVVYDPKDDKIGQFRGGGRIIQILKENFPEADFVNDLISQSFWRVPTKSRDPSRISNLLIPTFNPFSSPLITNKLTTSKQLLIIYDVIPLKYPESFPAGIKGNFNLWRNKQALKNFDKIITISESSKKDIIRWLSVPEEKVMVIYPTLSNNFISTSVIARNPAQRGTKQSRPILTNFNQLQPILTKYCLYVGDVNWNKNLVNLAKAIKLTDIPCVFVGKPFSSETWNLKPETLIRDKASSFRLQVSGLNHPWQQEFKQFLKEVGDDKRFIFLGYIPDEQLVQLYQNALCNVLVSHDEGFGLSYLEASSQKCPSVMSDIPVFREIAGESTLFCDHLSPASISENILKFLNSDLRRKIGEKAYKHIQRYSSENFRNNILNVIARNET